MDTNRRTAVASRNEMQLIARIVEGNGHLFRELVLPHQRQAYQVALRLLRNAADAEDVVQEALMSAHRNLNKFRGDSKFGSWLIRITLNQAKSNLRLRRIRACFSIDEPGSADFNRSREVPCRGQSPLDIVEQCELHTLLREAVAKLEPSYREVFMLRDCEGLSTISAADALGITIPATKVRLHRARRMLRKHLTILSREHGIN